MGITPTCPPKCLAAIRCPDRKIRGKRIRISAWIKTQNVRESADLDMQAFAADGTALAFQNSMDFQPIHGTMDWTQFEIVQDIPQEATKIRMAAEMWCTGEMWIDDYQG